MVIGRKLFEEIDEPIGDKIVYENSFRIESEASWTGIIKGYNLFLIIANYHICYKILLCWN
jgi:hypothetical protein